ncbi:MAG: LysR family transcriptional regulator [Anaerohalosphaera sp.]|nr:LysR family transcriptional regulator [Anaerohalosphaera sp.]
MSLLWIICGAGRNVGKTTVALHLCEILPDSVYAKCGHGKAKPEKPGNFFNNIEDCISFIDAAKSSAAHVVIESNALAYSQTADLVIFIDGIEGKTKFREDIKKLRAAANIKITCDATWIDWHKAISNMVGSKAVRDDVCDLLYTQKRYLFGSQPTARSKVWFEAAGSHIFGNGLAELFEHINRSGTLRQAAKASNMSYRHAWDLIRMAERHFGKELTDRHAGGQSGGNSKLSADGLHLLNVFKQLSKQVAVFTDTKFTELYTGNKNDVCH